jgi:hypothetical protein
MAQVYYRKFWRCRPWAPVVSLMNPGRARVSTACVSRILLGEIFSAFIVACKQKGCMVITVWNHVRSSIDHYLFQPHVKFGKF